MRKRKQQKYKGSVYQSFTLIMQFGLNMIVPIVICTFLGIFIDRKLNTSFWVIILFFVGALAGGRNIYLMAKGVYSDGKEHDGKDGPKGSD